MTDPSIPRHNEFGQPIGPEIPGWQPRPGPQRVDLQGTDVAVVDWDQQFVEDLYAATCGPDDGHRWTYMFAGPFRTTREFAGYTQGLQDNPTGHPVAILSADRSRVLGIAAFLAISPAMGSIEVGSITYGSGLARTRGATEAMYLMARHAFDDLGYRRYEWKCDALNAPSRSAALRLGFTYEGTFRNAVIYKGRSRNTAWFSITDAEWPSLRARLEAWLAPDNFEEQGRQIRPLAEVGPRGVSGGPPVRMTERQ